MVSGLQDFQYIYNSQNFVSEPQGFQLIKDLNFRRYLCNFQYFCNDQTRDAFRLHLDCVLNIPETCNFIKKDTPAQMFSCEFCKTFNNTFLQNSSEQLLPESVSHKTCFSETSNHWSNHQMCYRILTSPSFLVLQESLNCTSQQGVHR